MTKWEEMIEAFKSLSVEEKQQKLLAIFDFARDKFDFSDNAIRYLTSGTLPNELVMIKLYEFVVHATTAAQERIQKRQEELKNEMKERERREENQDSEDADKLLDLIDLL